jgi:predicted phage terminase large subunit-like protein
MIQSYEDLDCLPKSLRIYGASDYAVMEPRHGKREPDFTEHFIVGVDNIGDIWFVDNWSKQCQTDEAIAAFIRLVGLWKPVRWANEGGLIDKAIGPAIRSAMQHSQKFVAIESLPSLDDKAVKLQAFHARATAGTVHFPIRRAWADNCIEQLVKFPGGRWDDKADVCGLVGRMVDKMMDASLPSITPRPMIVPFTEAWLTFNDRNEKPKVRYF